MKKVAYILIILMLCTTIFTVNKIYAATPTLEQIVNAFNNSSLVKESATYGSVLKATFNKSELNIEVKSSEIETNLKYNLENNILSGTFYEDEALIGSMVSMYLIDSIETLHGYEEGEILDTLNSEELEKYTLENEGLEFTKGASEEIILKIDISKKVPLADFSNTYITVSDLDTLKEYITGDGFAEKRIGNVWFNKSGYNGKNTVLIAEKKELTDNTYKSLLSIIEVMFDSTNAVDYFKTNYKSTTVGNKEFDGFKIEINPEKTDFEQNLIAEDSGYKFARITIDKSKAIEAISNKNESQVPTENKNEGTKDTNSKDTTKEDNTVKKETLPQTGVSMTLTIILTIVVGLVALLKIKLSQYKDIK